MKQKVVIVGGGLAGLTAAYDLSRSDNFEVLLLEATSKVGGRVLTETVEGIQLDLGGFMIFPWYKYLRRLLAEIGLLNELAYTNSTVQFFQGGYNAPYTQANATPLRRLFPLRLRLSLVVPFLTGKLHYYEPNLSYFGDQSVATYLRKYLGPHSTTESMINSLVTAYTYGQIDQIPVSLYIGFAYKLFITKGFDRFKYLPGGTGRVIDALEAAIKANGGTIVTDTKVTKIAGATLYTEGESISADKIVFANGLYDGLIEGCIPALDKMRKATYTDNYAIFVETKEKVAINDVEAWMVAYNYNPRSQDPHIVSIGNLGVSLGYNKNILVFYVRVPDKETAYSEEGIRKLVLDEMRRYLPDASHYKIIDMHHWEHTMPVVTPAIVRSVRAAQGRHGYYFAGDYLGSPSMETAVYSGLQAAKMIRKSVSDHP